MDFQVSLTGVATGFGFFSALTFKSPEQEQEPAALVAASTAARGHLLNLTLGLDISGSMEPNMTHLVNAALAAVDLLKDGASLRIVLFDHDATEILPRVTMTPVTRASVKTTIREKVVNNGGATNIEAALVKLLTETNENQHVLLLTDGQANRGNAQTSQALINMARMLPNYSKYKIHCLGLQVAAAHGLNGELLKDLAVDTDGSYELVHDPELVAAFIGDVMGSHLLERMTKCSVRVATLAGEAKTVWGSSRQGFTLRADRPTTVVQKWSVTPAADSTAMVLYGQYGAEERSVTLPVASATPEAEVAVYKAIASELTAPKRGPLSDALPKLRDEIKAKCATNAALAPLLASIEALVPKPGAPAPLWRNEVETSRVAYAMTGLCATASSATEWLRTTSLQASQHQGPEDDDDDMATQAAGGAVAQAAGGLTATPAGV